MLPIEVAETEAMKRELEGMRSRTALASPEATAQARASTALMSRPPRSPCTILLCVVGGSVAPTSGVV